MILLLHIELSGKITGINLYEYLLKLFKNLTLRIFITIVKKSVLIQAEG